MSRPQSQTIQPSCDVSRESRRETRRQMRDATVDVASRGYGRTAERRCERAESRADCTLRCRVSGVGKNNVIRRTAPQATSPVRKPLRDESDRTSPSPGPCRSVPPPEGTRAACGSCCGCLHVHPGYPSPQSRPASRLSKSPSQRRGLAVARLASQLALALAARSPVAWPVSCDARLVCEPSPDFSGHLIFLW